MKPEQEESQKEQPDLVTLRTEYATLSHQLAQLDVNKQAGQWARLYRQVQAAEERLHQAEQETSPSVLHALARTRVHGNGFVLPYFHGRVRHATARVRQTASDTGK